MPQSLQSRVAAFACLAASILFGSAGAAFGQGVPAINEIVPPLGAGVVDQVGLSTVRLTFSEAVTIAPGAIRAWGVASGAIPLSTSWDTAANELIVTFDPAITAERVTLVVGPGVTGEFGDELDGEISNPMFPTIPTGDGIAGGVAVFRWDVLQGDANRDGVTNAADAQAVLAALGTCGIEPLADPDFDANADLNADGCVNVLDVQILLGGLGGALPPLDGTPPVIASISRDNGEPLTEDLSDLTITMSEPIVADGVVPTCVRIRSLDGQLFLPTSTVLLADERTIACHFDPPLSSCGDYTVLLASSIVDLSGEFFVAGGAAPAFTGSTPPPTPVLNAFPSATASAGVTLSGTIPDLPGFASAVEIRVQGIDQVVTVPVAGSTFSITVPLKVDNVNLLYVSAISPCGIAGAPVTAEVARDTEAPSLAVLYPPDGATTFDTGISVGGFVGDTLIGFEGLNVSVNGQPAIVDIGSGQLGTWVVPNLPLRNIGPTQLVIAASDALGNTSTQTITITRQAIPKNAATIERLAGDGQIGAVAASLPQPIRVKVWKADGTPWANKVVDFQVTQNDGRLDGNGVAADAMHFQSLTDASGEASATWTLGASSGCGNNRVEVTAKDVAGAITFSATALPGIADQINIGTGDGQRIETGGVAPLPLSAWVSDSRNPVGGVPVTFSVVSGNGTVNGANEATVTSDATGHAEVTFIAGTTPGANRVRATFPGNATNPAIFTVYGIARDITKPTSFKGLVFDNASQPIGNVKVTLKFQDQLVGPVLSNVQGQFEFPSIEHDGAVHVIVEGFLANKLNGKPLPPGVKFPSLGYDTVIVPNAENSLGRPVLLPPLLPENARVWDGQSDIELTCGGIDGLKYIVKANSMTLVNGNHPSPSAPVTLSINQVHHGAVPMPLPDGASPPFDATFYPPGATFDPPVAVEYPNMSALAPGAAVHFLTFNHDTGEFEAMAPGRVSEDGSTIRSEPGTGLTKSGWHGPGFPIQISGRCGYPGLCATADDEADELIGITVNGRCAASFTRFIVGPLYTDPPMNVAIFVADPGAAISWDLVPVGDHSGAVLEGHGTDPEFMIHPDVWPGVRPVGCQPNAPNPPIAYELTVTATTPQYTAKRTVRIEQDWVARLRQEYLDFNIWGQSSIAPPDWRYFKPPVGAEPCFAASDFNKGNFNNDVLPLVPSLVINGHGRIIAEKVAESFGCGIAISSSYRNPVRNRSVNACGGGDKNSKHMLGGAIDMSPDPFSYVKRMDLYFAAVQLPTSVVGEVLLEKGGVQLWPSRWLPPPEQWTVSGEYDGQPFSVSFGNSNPMEDPLPDTVTSVTPANLPAGLIDGLRFNWSGGGTPPNPTFYVHHVGGGFIAVGDPLVMDISFNLYTSFFTQMLPTLDNMLKTATHVHGQKSGIPEPPPDDANDEEAIPSEWTFSIAGQAVSTDPSASFSISNVNATDRWGPDGPGSPADGFGDEPIRAVGFSVIDGVTTYAYTEPFQIQANELVVIDAMTVTTTPVAMPVSIDLSAAPILEVDETTQVATTSHQNDGTALDVTPASSWTTYSTSNPALATVNADGLVTGHSPGTVFITAINGAATAVKKIIVTSDAGPTTIVGTVQLADGTPVQGAVVVTPLGGRGVSQQDGEFAFEVDVASQTTALNVTAVATVRGLTYQGTVTASPVIPLGLTDAGIILVTPGAACEPAWLPTFGGAPGLNGTVAAIASFDDGSGPALYVGGEFTIAGGRSAGHIARWNGQEWSEVGGGVSADVRALAVFDDGSGGGPALYVGGAFQAAGGNPIKYLARWNGARWSPVGASATLSTNGEVNALLVFDDGRGGGSELYVGGHFYEAGGAPAGRIAKWNGRSWSPVGNPTGFQLVGGYGGCPDEPPYVLTLASFDDGRGGGPSLIAGGWFDSIERLSTKFVARWDGAQWSGLGVGTNYTVRALATHNDGGGAALFVGGEFTEAGGVPAGCVARWNGSTWSVPAGGLGATVRALAAVDDGSGAGPQLFAGGEFAIHEPSGDSFGIARWNGSAWVSVAGGVDHVVTALAETEVAPGKHRLAVGGSFGSVGALGGGIPARRIAYTDGSSWTSLGSGFDGPVHTVTVFDDGSGRGPELVAGGSFSRVGGVSVGRIAKWNGTRWAPLGGGVDGSVLALQSFDDGSAVGQSLYVGGEFSWAGDVAVSNIARWDGRGWSAVGEGLNARVQALAVFDDRQGGGPHLCAGGYFNSSGEVPVPLIGWWNGRAWAPVGGGLGYGSGSAADSVSGAAPQVHALAVFDDGAGGGPSLYAGGYFFNAGTLHVSNVARWDGNAWSDVGGGVCCPQNFYDSPVHVLTTHDDGLGRGPQLYVGGPFEIAGPFGASHIARWDGVDWRPLGAGVPGSVHSLASVDDGTGTGRALFVGGANLPFGPPRAYLWRWDGVEWSSPDLGPNASVDALCGFDLGRGLGTALLVGGGFDVSPGGDSYLAVWGCDPTPNDSPRRPQPALARRTEHHAPPVITSETSDLRLRSGDSLILGDETRRYGSVVAEAGSTIRLTSRDSHLIVTNLTVEPGATFEWLGGTIEIDGGAWLHPYELTVGCDLEARLVLRSGAFVRAPKVVVCELGSLLGEGAIDAFVANAGAIAGEASGLRILGGYAQEPSGTIVASMAELDAVVAAGAHACSAVDALPFTTGLAQRQLVDVDGDGDLDLVRSIGTLDEPIVILWLDQGDGHFASPILCQSERAMGFVTIVDANGDGLLDVQLFSADGGSDITLLAGGDVEVTR